MHALQIFTNLNQNLNIRGSIHVETIEHYTSLFLYKFILVWETNRDIVRQLLDISLKLFFQRFGTKKISQN